MSSLAALLPDTLPVWAALILVVASFFTSALTAAFGVGGGTATLALLGVFIPVAALIPVHGAVQLGSNTGRAWHQRENIRWPFALPFFIGSVAGAIVGAMIVVQLPDAVMKPLLGAFIIAITWLPVPGLSRLSSLGLAIASSVLAILSMLFGATGALLSAIFGQIFSGDRKGLVATHAAGMTVQHGLKIIVFGAAGFAFIDWLPLVAAMICAGFLGTLYGTRLLEQLDEVTFKRWFKIAISLLAFDLIRQGISAWL